MGQKTQLTCPGTGRVPFFLQLHINAVCNLHCKHCYQDFTLEELKATLKSEEVYALLDQYRDFLNSINGFGTIYFTGGEPILDPNLSGYVRRARELQIFPRVLSNGTLITADKARELANAGAGVVQVSLDGLEQTHDIIRGKGNFQKATSGLDACHAAGIQTTVMVTINRSNVPEFSGILAHAIAHKVTRISMGRLIPTGSGTQLSEDVLSTPELKTFFKQLNRFKRAHEREIEFAIHDPLWMRFLSITTTAGCSVGRHGICVIHNGDIMPCRRMNTVIGNIRQTTLIEMWDSPALAHYRTRDNYEGKCGTCKHLQQCGGCRAMARATTGADYGPDPNCLW